MELSICTAARPLPIYWSGGHVISASLVDGWCITDVSCSAYVTRHVIGTRLYGGVHPVAGSEWLASLATA
jgi:hypothetical protein